MHYIVAVLLLLGAHFNLTATAPAEAGKGSIIWPFAADSRPALVLFGAATTDITHLLSIVAGAGFLAAALALFGIVVPGNWFSPLVIAASLCSALLYLLYFGPWALIPILIDAILLWGILGQNWSITSLRGS